MVSEGAGSYENPEPGSYAAVCNQIIDLGTQEGEYQGNKIRRRQVIMGWELAEKNSKGEPFRVSAFYTASLSEKSKLRPMLEAWRGSAFTIEELGGFSLTKVLGKPCMVSLILNDKNKIRVSSVSKLPKGMPVPTLTTGLTNFDLDEFDPIALGKLSPKIQDMVKKSPEYAKATSGGHEVEAEHEAQEPEIVEEVGF